MSNASGFSDLDGLKVFLSLLLRAGRSLLPVSLLSDPALAGLPSRDEGLAEKASRDREGGDEDDRGARRLSRDPKLLDFAAPLRMAARVDAGLRTENIEGLEASAGGNERTRQRARESMTRS